MRGWPNLELNLGNYSYGLDKDDLAVVYETFSETVDYSYRHAAVLTHFRMLTG